MMEGEYVETTLYDFVDALNYTIRKKLNITYSVYYLSILMSPSKIAPKFSEYTLRLNVKLSPVKSETVVLTRNIVDNTGDKRMQIRAINAAFMKNVIMYMESDEEQKNKVFEVNR
jgi:hypothetical protein